MHISEAGEAFITIIVFFERSECDCMDQEPLLKRLHNKEELTHQVTEKIKRSYKKNINVRYFELFCVILEININI